MLLLLNMLFIFELQNNKLLHMQSYTANKRNGILKYIVNIWAMRIY